MYFQSRTSIAPELKQWVRLVVLSCEDHLPTESRLAAAQILTGTAPLFLTAPHPVLGKYAGILGCWGEVGSAEQLCLEVESCS